MTSYPYIATGSIKDWSVTKKRDRNKYLALDH